MQRRLRFFVIASLALVPALAIAWTGPTQTAPNGNVAAPINTGASAQVKSGDFAVLGNVGLGTPTPGYKLHVAGNSYTSGAIYGNEWFRVMGGGGIYWQDYGGGWYMQDPTWVRVVNNRNVYTGSYVRADSGFCIGGTCRSILGPGLGGVYYYDTGGANYCPGEDIVVGVNTYNYAVGNLCSQNGCITSYQAQTAVWCRDIY